MKKLIGLLMLMGIGGPAFAGSGVASSLTVSSGTFKAIRGFNDNAGGFIQGVAVADSSYTYTAPVDSVTGLTVNLATSTLTTATAVRVDGSATTQPISGTVAATQSGTWNVGTVTAVTAISNALPTGTNNIGTVTGSTVTIVNPSGGTLAVSGTVNAAQSGTWTVQPGNTANSTAWFVNPYSETTIGDGLLLIDTAGTREALAGSTAIKRTTVCSHNENTGILVIGGTTVVAASASRRGVPLSPGDCYTVLIDNLADINVDATVSGSTATYTYEN